MELDTLYALLVSAMPALAAIISIIAAIVKMAKDNKEVIKPVVEQFTSLRAEVRDKTELEAVKTEMQAIMAENRQIRQELADLITEMKKVKYDVPNN
jgi:uncharacterized protein (DUF3084 family)